eukprot:5466509-Amphidinium_carterae.1
MAMVSAEQGACRRRRGAYCSEAFLWRVTSAALFSESALSSESGKRHLERAPVAVNAHGPCIRGLQGT